MSTARQQLPWSDSFQDAQFLADEIADSPPSRATKGPVVHAPSPPGAYAEHAGRALFLAAAYRTTGSRVHAEAAARCFEPLVRLANSPTLLAGLSLGGYEGIGGLAYALVRGGDWLDDPGLVDAAGAVSSTLTPGAVAGSASVDLATGLAGCVQPLMVLAHASGNTGPLHQARYAGTVLADRAMMAGCGRLTWLSRGVRVDHGLSHGTAGIALSLMQLWKRTGIGEFRQVASRVTGTEDAATGDPGRSLAYAVMREVDRSFPAPPARIEPLTVDVCTADLLLELGRRSGNPAHVSAARDIVPALLRERSSGPAPPLMRGLAGVGYLLLRLHDPSLPCLLLLD